MVKTGPDGKMYTVTGPAPIDLERIRRETRDVIQGNVEFHVDPFAAPKPEPAPVELRSCFCQYLGGTCDTCAEESW